ncbi:MAG: hypothetical protein DHS20C21_18710 [Gemmatimonadota bacterium]|nr:MAG: hypothetical protein DHS20C21_18710 [Gemmatimonadota bacterium]
MAALTLLWVGCGGEPATRTEPEASPATEATANQVPATSPPAADTATPAPPARIATPRITADSLLARSDTRASLLILDTRSHDEFRQGHVPGAILIPHDQVARRTVEIMAWQNRDVVVYCRSGRRAEYAENQLREAGFTRLLHLEGDWRAWSAAGHPVEK